MSDIQSVRVSHHRGRGQHSVSPWARQHRSQMRALGDEQGDRRSGCSAPLSERHKHPGAGCRCEDRRAKAAASPRVPQGRRSGSTLLQPPTQKLDTLEVAAWPCQRADPNVRLSACTLNVGTDVERDKADRVRIAPSRSDGRGPLICRTGRPVGLPRVRDPARGWCEAERVPEPARQAPRAEVSVAKWSAATHRQSAMHAFQLWHSSEGCNGLLHVGSSSESSAPAADGPRVGLSAAPADRPRVGSRSGFSAVPADRPRVGSRSGFSAVPADRPRVTSCSAGAHGSTGGPL